jgi:hypothetical protein
MFEVISFFASAGITVGVITEIIAPIVTQGVDVVKSIL